MSTGITFSGFNNIDFSYILEAIMTQESQPVRTLQTQQSALKSQKAAFSTLASKLSTLESSLEALADKSEFGGKSVTTSDSTAVAVSGTAGANAGSYDVVVNTLAKAQTTVSATTLPDKDTTTVASGGTLVINGVAVTVTVPATLQDLADAINAADDVDVTASVVSITPGSYELVLTGKGTGTDGAFTVQNNLTGGSGISFTDTDGDGVSGDTTEDNAQDAGNATFSVNNVAVTSQTNTVADVIPGVTLQLLKKDPAATVNVAVAVDQQAGKDQIEAFVTAFNDLMSFVSDQAKSATAGDQSSIGRDALLRALRTDLRTALNDKYAVGGTYDYLSQVGIGFTRDGKLNFDGNKYDEATKNGTGEVLKLFAGANGGTGAFSALSSLLTTYTDAGGLLPNAEDRLDAALTSIGNRIDAMNARLALRRSVLSKEFTATDTAIRSLNDSVKSLSSLSSSYSSF
jgi:flagellar hook-associated protein 2